MADSTTATPIAVHSRTLWLFPPLGFGRVSDGERRAIPGSSKQFAVLDLLRNTHHGRDPRLPWKRDRCSTVARNGPHVNSIAAMIRAIRFLHEDIVKAVRMVHKVSTDSDFPPKTCPESTQMHERLRQVESDVREHVELEENILFPRVIELEATSQARQPASE